MSGRRVGIAQAASSDQLGRGALLVIGMGIVLLAGGLMLSGSASAAPEDPPSVLSIDEINSEQGQTIVIKAENTNNDQTTMWDFTTDHPELDYQTRTADSNRSFFIRTTIPSDFTPKTSINLNITATDGQGFSDSSQTRIGVLETDASIEPQPAKILETGELTFTPPEDTDIDLRVHLDDMPATPEVGSLEVVKNYPGGVTLAASSVGGGGYAAGAFNYEFPGVHDVGYRVTDNDTGAQVIVVQHMDVLEKAPDLSTPVDELEIAAGQRLSFEIVGSDSDGETLDLRIKFFNDQEVSDVELNQDGDTARFWGTFQAHEGDGETWVRFVAEDPHGEITERIVKFHYSTTPSITTSSPASVLEDTDVTLTGSVDTNDIDASTMRIWKNFEWEDALFVDKFQSNQVDADTWEATFNYGLPAVHHPGYQVELADGDRLTLVGSLEVLEQGPSLTLPGGMRGDSGQTVAVIAEGADSDGEDLSWEISGGSDVKAKILDLGSTQVWQWQIPYSDTPDTVDLTFTATDPHGKSITDSTTVRVSDDSLAEPALPQETSTGLFVANPIVDLEVNLATSIDEVTTPAGIVDDWPASLDSPLATTETEDGLQEAQTVFAETGHRQIGYLLEANNGGLAAVVQDIQVVENTAPDVDAGSDLVYEGNVTAELRGHTADPEGRVLTDADHEWYLVDSPLLASGEAESLVATGAHTSGPELGPGQHTFELRVTDPYGETGADQLTISIDDGITARGFLDSATGQTQDGTYVVSPTSDDPFSRIRGQVEVVDDLGNPVGDAKIEGTVLYFGIAASPVGLEVATFTAETGDDGVAEFDYDKELLGGIGRGESVASGPGYHEIQITASADSRPNAAFQDTETASVTLPYWVGPSGTAPLTR